MELDRGLYARYRRAAPGVALLPTEATLVLDDWLDGIAGTPTPLTGCSPRGCRWRDERHGRDGHGGDGHGLRDGIGGMDLQGLVTVARDPGR